MSRISPFLWYDSEAEAAAQLYVSIFPNSKITSVSRYGEAGPGKPRSAMTVSFELDGLPVTALNGGPHFKLTEAFSMSVDCADQTEVDRYWNALIEDGGQPSRCGWLKDRFGLSWQIVPRALPRLLTDPDRAKAQRVMAAMLKMSKLDVAQLEAAAASSPPP